MASYGKSAHRWSGFPGGYCQDCGTESAMEDAIHCRECWVPCCPEDDEINPEPKLCAKHQLWADANATCPPDPELVKKFHATYPQGE